MRISSGNWGVAGTTGARARRFQVEAFENPPRKVKARPHRRGSFCRAPALHGARHCVAGQRRRTPARSAAAARTSYGWQPTTSSPAMMNVGIPVTPLAAPRPAFDRPAPGSPDRPRRGAPRPAAAPPRRRSRRDHRRPRGSSPAASAPRRPPHGTAPDILDRARARRSPAHDGVLCRSSGGLKFVTPNRDANWRVRSCSAGSGTPGNNLESDSPPRGVFGCSSNPCQSSVRSNSASRRGTVLCSAMKQNGQTKSV